MASFKHHANAADLREVQCAVLWEWAVSTSLPLPHAAAVFCRDYRRIWPLLQLGDPLIQDDRMFSVDQRDVLIILRKQEEKYGRYDTGSSTDPSTNIFQKVTVAHVAHGPVWVRNTQGPRSHVEGLLRKYGVPYRPSHSPGVRMTEFFRNRSLIAKPTEASFDDKAYAGPPSPNSVLSAMMPVSPQYTSFSSPRSIGSVPSSPLGMPLGEPRLGSPMRRTPIKFSPMTPRSRSPPQSALVTRVRSRGAPLVF